MARYFFLQMLVLLFYFSTFSDVVNNSLKHDQECKNILSCSECYCKWVMIDSENRIFDEFFNKFIWKCT